MSADVAPLQASGGGAGSREDDASAAARPESARVRHSLADKRDAMADWRDRVATMRDDMATQFEQEDDASEARDSQRAANDRVQAAGLREAAAKDRAHAAEDRRHSALDRAAAEAELAGHGTDHLTGTLRRHVGLEAMQREWDRSERTRQAFVAAFLDVNGLKAVNADRGHKAGDELLQAVTRCVKDRLRSYDLIARYGGDEFVISISGQDVAGARRRFDLIAEQLARTTPGATVTVGLAEREPGDTLMGLIERADAAMRARRQGS
jgi:diguanylate cyclase (GGDEF)-like protein